MTATGAELYASGDLAAAIQVMIGEVRSHPGDVNKRGFLAELLSFAGDLERADKQLDVIVDQAPDAAAGLALFRQLIRAEQARQQYFSEGRVPEFLGDPTPAMRLLMEASIALRDGKGPDALALVGQAEEARPAVAGTNGGQPFDDMRDIDDLTAGVFEVLTSTGKYYWIPTERVLSIDTRPPQRPRDLLWRRVHMEVEEGPEGEVYLPTIYPPFGEIDDRTRLGRLSDWVGGEDAPVRGIGQRCFLVGDTSVPITQLGDVVFAREEQD